MARTTRQPTAPERPRFASQHDIDFARKYGISIEQVEDLMGQYGHEQARLDAAAKRLPD
jgi:hypothetical protein